MMDINDFLKAGNKLSCPACSHCVQLTHLHYDAAGDYEWIEWSCNRAECNISFSFSPDELQNPSWSMVCLKRQFGHATGQAPDRINHESFGLISEPPQSLDAKLAEALEVDSCR